VKVNVTSGGGWGGVAGGGVTGGGVTGGGVTGGGITGGGVAGGGITGGGVTGGGVTGGAAGGGSPDGLAGAAPGTLELACSVGSALVLRAEQLQTQIAPTIIASKRMRESKADERACHPPALIHSMTD
jgi:hypothetical protein